MSRTPSPISESAFATPGRYRRLNNATFSRRRSRSLDELRSIFVNLSPIEKDLVKDSWDNRYLLDEKRTNGLPNVSRALQLMKPSQNIRVCRQVLTAFVNIITNTPREYWSSLKITADTPDGLRQCPRVRAHAAKVEQFLSAVIELLNTAREFQCTDLITSLGRRHTNFRIHFDASTWLVFKRSIIDSICENQLSGAIVAAWTKFVGHLVGEIKNGFNREICFKHSHQQRKRGSIVAALLMNSKLDEETDQLERSRSGTE